MDYLTEGYFNRRVFYKYWRIYTKDEDIQGEFGNLIGVYNRTICRVLIGWPDELSAGLP